MNYVYAGGGGSGPLETERAGVPYWYLTDSLGSTRLVTDTTGLQAANYTYSPFGRVNTSSGSLALTNEILFAGQRTDPESGLQYLRARNYDPASGTFLQRDTWGGNDNNSQSQNRYLYAQGDPINRIDPSGRCDNSLFGLIGCAGDKTRDLAGGVGNAIFHPDQTWSDTGGGLVNQGAQKASALVGGGGDLYRQTIGNNLVNPAVGYVVNHPMQVLTVAGIIGACAILGGPMDPLCLAVAGGALAGASGYTIGHYGKSDWSWDDFASNAVLGEVIGATLYAGVGGPLTLAPKAPIWGLTGAAVIAENLVGNNMIGHPSGFSQICSSVTSFLPGFKGLVGSLGCSGTDRFLGN
jgi:RHS repeat-associated protein